MEPASELEPEVAPHLGFAAVTGSRHPERWFCGACDSEPGDGDRLTRRRHGRPAAQLQPQRAGTPA